MISKLELAWETYDFYTHEIQKHEETHTNMLKTLKRFVRENPHPKKYQKDRVKTKCKESCSKLNVLYNKQIDAINDLISLHSDIIDIPPERDVDIASLISLKNTTVTLMNAVHQYQLQIENILD